MLVRREPEMGLSGAEMSPESPIWTHLSPKRALRLQNVAGEPHLNALVAKMGFPETIATQVGLSTCPTEKRHRRLPHRCHHALPGLLILLVGVLVLIVVIAKEVPVVIGLLVVVVLPARAALKDKRDEQAYEHAANHEAHHAGPVGEEPGEEVLHT